MKILVRGTNWIGDSVMSIPALRELRRIFVDGHITLHVRSWADGLFQNAEFIDELVTFDENRWKIKDVYDNSQFLKGDRYDLAILFPNSFESALTTFLTRVPRRIGYNKDARGLLLTDPIAVPEWKDRRHEVYYYLHLIAETERRMLGPVTVFSIQPDTSLTVSNERKVAARQILAGAGLDLSNRIVAIGAGSTNSLAKRWPAENYARLCDRLQAELGVSVVLVGSNAENDVAEAVAKSCGKRPVNLTGKTGLAEVVAILSEVDMLISNDMGLAHVAPAVGTLTIVLFGPTNSKTTRPFSDNAAVLRKDVECSPCMLRDCPIDHRCMTWLSVDEVFAAADNILNGKYERGLEAKEGNSLLMQGNL